MSKMEKMETLKPSKLHLKEFETLSDEHLISLANNYKNINAVHYVDLCMKILNSRKN